MRIGLNLLYYLSGPRTVLGTKQVSFKYLLSEWILPDTNYVFPHQYNLRGRQALALYINQTVTPCLQYCKTNQLPNGE